MEKTDRKKLAFTLIELLIVISIIAILAGILLPALKKAKDKVNEINCRNNLKQIASAVIMYQNDFNGFLPCSRATRTSDPAMYYKSFYDQIQEYLGCKSTIPDFGVFQCKSNKDKFYYLGRYTSYGANHQVFFYASNTSYPSSFVQYHKLLYPSELAGIIEADGTLFINPAYNAELTVNNVNPRHGGGVNIMYMDGHTGWRKAPVPNTYGGERKLWLPNP
ncbi:MAG: hypothetical protein A2017_12995 [Lentisphaerae bacterium GWF2_44_16]|nr:MAG: hypothetical protein A2017_12995 [Lentisphaerae bacterium GWF2_44_16]